MPGSIRRTGSNAQTRSAVPPSILAPPQGTAAARRGLWRTWRTSTRWCRGPSSWKLMDPGERSRVRPLNVRRETRGRRAQKRGFGLGKPPKRGPRYAAACVDPRIVGGGGGTHDIRLARVRGRQVRVCFQDHPFVTRSAACGCPPYHKHGGVRGVRRIFGLARSGDGAGHPRLRPVAGAGGASFGRGTRGENPCGRGGEGGAGCSAQASWLRIRQIGKRTHFGPPGPRCAMLAAPVLNLPPSVWHWRTLQRLAEWPPRSAGACRPSAG